MNSELGLDEVFARMEPGAIKTIAGVGYVEGVPARDAPAGWPMGIARNVAGDLFVVDYWGHRIWRIDADGVLHSYAGQGVPGNSGDGGPAAEARFDQPHDLRIDDDGNLYLSDLGNSTIRRIDAATGSVTTIAGSGKTGRGGDSEASRSRQSSTPTAASPSTATATYSYRASGRTTSAASTRGRESSTGSRGGTRATTRPRTETAARRLDRA